MRRTEQRQGVRMLKLRDVLTRWEAGWLSQLEAAEIVGMSERSVRRWTRRFEEEGEDGLLDRRLGRRSGRAVPEDEADEVGRLYRERYAGFTAKHCHEHLVRDHGFRWGYRWTKTSWQSRGYLARAPRRAPSQAAAPAADRDDAASRRVAARLARGPRAARPGDHPGRRPQRDRLGGSGRGAGHGLELPGVAETLAAQGLPCSLDTDRGSPSFHTPEAGGPVAKGTLTPVGRALAQLGIEPIPASSPEARGRCERAFRTLQDRLPKELARAGMTTIAAAHAFLREVSLPAHNARFATKPAEEGSAFGLVAEAQWRDLLCIQEERTVAPDNPVSWNGRRLQIPPHPARAPFVKAKVRIHDYPDGTLAIFHGPRGLVRWRPDRDTTDRSSPSGRRVSRFRDEPTSVDGLDEAPPRPTRPQTATNKAVNLCAT